MMMPIRHSTRGAVGAAGVGTDVVVWGAAAGAAEACGPLWYILSHIGRAVAAAPAAAPRVPVSSTAAVAAVMVEAATVQQYIAAAETAAAAAGG